MKILMLILAFGFADCLNAFEWSPDDRRREAEQVQLWEENFEKSAAMTEEEKLDFLSLGLRNMGYRSRMPEHVTDVDVTYKKIQSAILAIPGYTDFYRQRIEKARVTLDQAESEVTLGPAQHYLFLAHSHNVGNLRELPSVETVKALGEMLFDDRGMAKRKGMDIQEVLAADPTCNWAANTLGVMIQNPPVPPVPPMIPSNYISPDGLSTWRLWYERVRAGTQSFKFVGDPREYRLTEAPGRDPGRAPRRPLPTPALGSSGGPVSPGAMWAGILAALALVAGAASYWLRGRRLPAARGPRGRAN